MNLNPSKSMELQPQEDWEQTCARIVDTVIMTLRYVETNPVEMEKARVRVKDLLLSHEQKIRDTRAKEIIEASFDAKMLERERIMDGLDTLPSVYSDAIDGHNQAIVNRNQVRRVIRNWTISKE